MSEQEGERQQRIDQQVTEHIEAQERIADMYAGAKQRARQDVSDQYIAGVEQSFGAACVLLTLTEEEYRAARTIFDALREKADNLAAVRIDLVPAAKADKGWQDEAGYSPE